MIISVCNHGQKINESNKCIYCEFENWIDIVSDEFNSSVDTLLNRIDDILSIVKYHNNYHGDYMNTYDMEKYILDKIGFNLKDLIDLELTIKVKRNKMANKSLTNAR